MNTWPVPRALAFWILVASFENVAHCKDSGKGTSSTPTSGNGKSNSLKLVELDTSKMKDTEAYSYLSSSFGYMFTAKQGYGFKKVKSNDKDVWEDKDGKTHATSVTDVSHEHVIITFKDGSKKEFELKTKNCCCKEWKEENARSESTDSSKSQQPKTT